MNNAYETSPQIIAEQNLAAGLVPCHGLGRWFTSSYPADHAIAKPICRMCPATQFLACRELLNWELAQPGADPEGTYAGRHVGARKSPGRPKAAA